MSSPSISGQAAMSAGHAAAAIATASTTGASQPRTGPSLIWRSRALATAASGRLWSSATSNAPRRSMS
jgi:hypothetical protein